MVKRDLEICCKLQNINKLECFVDDFSELSQLDSASTGLLASLTDRFFTLACESTPDQRISIELFSDLDVVYSTWTFWEKTLESFKYLCEQSDSQYIMKLSNQFYWDEVNGIFGFELSAPGLRHSISSSRSVQLKDYLRQSRSKSILRR